MSHSLVWVDIPVTDLNRAIRFYAAVLAGPVTTSGGPDFVFALLPHAGTDVSGCLFTAGADNAPGVKGPLVYLNAEGRLADAVKAVSEHGGKVLEEVHAIGPHGFRAVVIDSEGNRIALHSPTL